METYSVPLSKNWTRLGTGYKPRGEGRPVTYYEFNA
jgi:hypothetical protein